MWHVRSDVGSLLLVGVRNFKNVRGFQACSSKKISKQKIDTQNVCGMGLQWKGGVHKGWSLTILLCTTSNTGSHIFFLTVVHPIRSCLVGVGSKWELFVGECGMPIRHNH